MKYYIVELNGQQYTAHEEGGRAPSTEAEIEFWRQINKLETAIAHALTLLAQSQIELAITELKEAFRKG